MAYKVKSKKSRKPKYAYELRIGKDVIRAKSKKELDEKLDKGVILWHYKVPKNF